MQMQNASPQGIAGLMQQRPQQPQMPSPNKASPMAGLGSVDDRVAAYMGNTKPLEQRYAMSQDLLDLLALQKIKSQKEAAARQMQLQMAQQGQQNGQANMTVAQQREQEVNELTKNELAQQRGDTAQKQAGDQQAAMQKMMSGIAAAPGAAAAAQPKAMAAGGIVHFDDGGPTGKKPLDEQAQLALQEAQRTGDRNAMMMTIKKLAAAGYDVATLIPRGVMGAAESVVRGVADSRLGRALGLDAIPKLPESAYGGDRTSMTPMMDKIRREEAAANTPPQAAPAGPPVSPAYPDESRRGPAANVPPASVVAAAQNAPRPPAPPAGPKPPAAPGIAGLPGAAAAPAGPAVAPANDFGSKLEAAALKNAEIDPAARQLDEERRVEGRLALTPDQRKVYEEGIGGLQQMYQQQYDPERLQREGLKRALIGAGGRRYGEFAGAASAGMDYDEKMRAAKLKEFGDVQKARTGLIDLDRGVVKEGIGAGQKAYEQGSLSQRQGLESGSKLYSTDVETRNKALDREIEKLKIKAQQDATAAQRESLSYDKARTVYSATLGKVQELERRLDDDFSKQYGMLLMAEQSGKMDASQKNQLETAKLQLQQQKAKIRRELEPVLESARQKLGVTSTDGFGEMKKVETKK